jgi:hypothetical protein
MAELQLITTVLGCGAFILNSLALGFYIRNIQQGKKKNAVYIQVGTHFLASAMGLTYTIVTVRNLDPTWIRITNALHFCYFIVATWYYFTIMAAMAFLNNFKPSALSVRFRTNEILTQKFFSMCSYVFTAILMVLNGGMLIYDPAIYPENHWVSKWFIVSAIGAVLFTLLSWYVAIDVNFKLNKVVREEGASVGIIKVSKSLI